MQYPNLFKRIIPFALALMLGLFVAGFFVTLTPSFRGKGRMFRQMRVEHENLKAENERLKLRVQELEEKNEVPWEDNRKAAAQDLLDRRCFPDVSKTDSEMRKQLIEREKQLTELIKKLEPKDKK